MILARYIAARFLRSVGLVSAGFAAVLLFVQMVEEMRRFAGAGIGVAGAAGLAALQLPEAFHGLIAMVALLGAITLFLALGRSSELVAVRASGRSALRLLVAPALTAALLGALAVVALNPIVAATAQRHARAVEALGGPAQTLSLGEGVVWLRQALGDGGGQVVIRAARADPAGAALHDATFLIVDAAEGPVRRVAAATARLEPGAWVLTDVTSWALADANPQASVARVPEQRLASDLTPERIRDGVGDPEAVSVWALPGVIASLERAGFSAQRHRVQLHRQLALPALMAAMVLVAAAFTLGHRRGGRAGLAALTAFGAGLGLFFLAGFAQVLGESGDLPPWLAAWAAPAIGTLAALGRLLRQEDG